MDFHAAMETFAEAWVAANTQTVVNSDPQVTKQSNVEDLPTLLPKEQIVSPKSDKSPPNRPMAPQPLQQSTSPNAGTKSLPIHCIIEQTNGPLTFDQNAECTSTCVELDSYAILPGSTLIGEIVRAALMTLGYSANDAMNAKGAIQIKNWKPLSFDSITDDAKATVEKILGELTQVATLRIRLTSKSKLSSTDEVKEKLLKLLLSESHGLLSTAGCPIEKNLLSSISKGENSLATISPEVRRNFDKWYSEQIQKSQQQETQVERIEPIQEQERSPKTSTSPVISTADHTQNQSIILAPGKTRMRTSFDPDHEIPRLQKWFQDNQHPTREQMLNFLSELNGLDSRKGRRPLDLTNIIYWFKNARAAHRRASKSLDDSSYEVDDNSGHSPTNLDPNIPYLPNKNAVYLLPYAMHPFISPSDMHDPKEPCDLSQAKKIHSFQNQEKKENIQPLNGTQEKDNGIIINNMDVNKSENGLNMVIKTVKEEKVEVVAKPLEVDLSAKQDVSQSDQIDTTIPPDRTSNQPLMQSPERCSNSGHMSESDDDEYDSDISNDGDSFSSHDDGDSEKIAVKKEHGNDQEYINAQMAHMSGMTSASGQQPLHIPQFPHPLAMHYFPFNTHLFAQQSARYQQQHPHHPAKLDHNHVHNNNHGHRKRRTRVLLTL
ncbi:hypothetical protein ScPMuIL_009086 [Solemya velum]